MKVRIFLPALLLASLIAAGSAFAAVIPDNPPGGAPVIDEGLPTGRLCATPIPTEEEQQSVQTQIRNFQQEFGALAVGGQIKVAFHVIYSGSTGNIPQSQIDAQIAELNKAYSGFYGGVNTGYTFVLASVSRTNNASWFTMTPGTSKERQAKQALATDVAHRLNVYTCKPGQNLLGWSYFPSDYAETNWHHGVVFHYASVPGGSLAPYNLGGTLDHEVGHYLGLYHTFQGGCSGSGDQIADTPAEATATAGCPAGKNTCSAAGDDPIHNYMDYSDDACYNQFTAGQDVRMDAQVPLYRPNLLNALATTPEIESKFPDLQPVTVPRTLAFRGASPNPFTGATNVVFSLPKSDHVSLEVYNVAGQRVATLMNRDAQAGDHSVEFRANGISPGMYFMALRVGDGSQIVRSVVLVK